MPYCDALVTATTIRMNDDDDDDGKHYTAAGAAGAASGCWLPVSHPPATLEIKWNRGGIATQIAVGCWLRIYTI